MLDRYVDSLIKEAEAREKEKTLAQLSFVDLAKLAGMKVAESTCHKCGSKMEKSGDMYKCSCGMSKAASMKSVLPLIEDVVDVGIRAASKSGGGVKPPPHKELKARLEHITGEHNPAQLHLPKAGEPMGKQASVKEAGLWTAAKGLASRMGSSVAQGGKDIARTFQHARGLGAGGMGPVRPGAQMGIGKALLHTAGQHPGAAAAAAAVPLAAGGGYVLGKQSSALFEAGDAAGRLMAKLSMAPDPSVEGVPISELKESIQEAQGREDPAARARKWAIGGGVGGGLAGAGLGAGAYRILNKLKVPHAAGIGGGVGAGLGLAGVLGGSYLGSRHGAQEARADRLLEKIRGQRAYEAGENRGIGEGYMGAQGGMGESVPQ
jgi:hypothetical protein